MKMLLRLTYRIVEDEHGTVLIDDTWQLRLAGGEWLLDNAY